QSTIAVELQPLFQRLGGLSDSAAPSTSSVVVLVVLTIFAMVLGELVPKSLALQFPTQTGLATVRPMRWSLALFSWFISFLNGSGTLILRMLGVTSTGHHHIHSPDELDLLIAESRQGGLLDPAEHRRLRRALQLAIRPARHLMVPRPQITAIEITTPLPEVVRIVSESPYTRIPVYRGSIDQVMGILHTRDLFSRYIEGRTVELEALIRPILIVHESITADRLLALMRERRSHQAIVADEFGGVAGLVTLEDVLTEVMGQVADEFKVGEPQPERLPDGRVRLPGFLRLDEAEPWLGLLLEGDADTVGGRVSEELGHVPDVGEKVMIAGVEMEVEAVENHAVTSVIARPNGMSAWEGDDE
nr:hemolysin family protein [Gemmatimonadota bacterium]